MKRGIAAVLVAAALPLACAKSVTETTFLQAEDLAGDGVSFSRNELIDTASFIDTQGIALEQVQGILEHTPYGRPSFLATYQSNGVRASDAIMKSSIAHSLNPLVFLARAEMEQGLLGERSYPSTPARVEYAFGCGCDSRGHCDPALGGFDVQVECLAIALRKNLDDIAANGATSGGWGPNKQSTTLDGESVTPQDAATAALYQYTPVVGFGSSGNWLFWNIWQLYATTLQYAGPLGPIGGAFIGDPCTDDPTCSYPGGICATNYPGGLCTASCTDACPVGGMAAAYCASFQQAGYCLQICDPMTSMSCRTGYSCKKVQKFGSATDSQFVCVAD